MSDESKQTLEGKIKEIGGEDGFWKSGTEEALLKIAREWMKKYSMPEDDAVDYLEKLFGIVSGEYGN